MTENGITLEQLLLARDRRRQRQLDLLANTNGDTLLQLSVVMPGNVKRNEFSAIIADDGVKAVVDKFGDALTFSETNDAPTGFEAFFLVKMPEKEVKRLATEIEDTIPLGRLIDLDVIDSSGIPLSRKQLGLPERKCLICDNDARTCMRAATHTTEEILAHIARMIDERRL